MITIKVKTALKDPHCLSTLLLLTSTKTYHDHKTSTKYKLSGDELFILILSPIARGGQVATEVGIYHLVKGRTTLHRLVADTVATELVMYDSDIHVPYDSGLKDPLEIAEEYMEDPNVIGYVHLHASGPVKDAKPKWSMNDADHPDAYTRDEVNAILKRLMEEIVAGTPSQDRELRDQLHAGLPEIFREDGRIDVMALAVRAERVSARLKKPESDPLTALIPAYTDAIADQLDAVDTALAKRVLKTLGEALSDINKYRMYIEGGRNGTPCLRIPFDGIPNEKTKRYIQEVMTQKGWLHTDFEENVSRFVAIATTTKTQVFNVVVHLKN